MNYASFDVTLNYLMHKIMEFRVTSFCQTLGNKRNHLHRVLRGGLFSKGKI